MFKIEEVSYFKLLAFHIGLALAIIAFKPLLLVYFHLVVLYFLFRIIQNRDREGEVLVASLYIISIEVFCRMTNQLIFYEECKYLIAVFALLGILYRGLARSSFFYIFCVVLLIPAILVSSTNIPAGESFRKMIAFNLSGPVSLLVCAMYYSGRKFDFKTIQLAFNLSICAILMMAINIIFFTPANLSEVVTNTTSNFSTSGGFGPNQVSTVLGLGMFITFMRFIITKGFLNNIIDLTLFALFAWRGYITFSRGGVLTAIAMIAITLIIIVSRKNRVNINKRALSFKFILLSLTLTAAFIYTSIQTGGLIENRYSNEDSLGREKQDATAGRSDISSLEIRAFLENPILGLGIGQSKFYRQRESGVLAASHNELTRTISEQGALGLLLLLLLFFVPSINYLTSSSNLFFLAFIGFWFATINHSAMRIAAPSLMYAFSLIKINFEPVEKVSLERINREKISMPAHI